ncbi:phage tail tape measure protein [Mycobacterium sp. IS-1556]|uniref:phage tail tape measure protein n=1 Tax=Mycobacterium sp. IS-1556 TaxID=1772276 RepID=UPI000741841F|nr:phage tail tape measure protein [Mycobacterium sp. IS-1556]KUH90623.1 hypothetical protein AU187_24435 [Mycobacterium sp. IS-1556]
MTREFTEAGQNAGTRFSREFEQRMRNVDASSAANNAAREFGSAGTRAGRQFADSATSGMRGEFSDAGREAAREFQRSFERQANPRVDINARTAAADAGDDAGDSFTGGFTGALAGLGSRGGPIGAAIAGGALAGIKLIGPQIEAAMALEASQDLTAARLGLDDATMKKVADGAAQAFSSNWGESIEANLGTATAAIQSGLLAPSADTGDVQKMIAQLTDVSTLLGDDIPAVARSAAQAIRTGIATDATQAFDLLVVGQQKGLNVSGDLLDTVDEYSTQFRKLGLTGEEAFGLLTQAVKGGARDTDIAADALKEFSIRAVDGSKTTTDAFTALGLDADEMARRFVAGGRASATAFDQVVDKIRGIHDPVEQSRIAVELFGTQAEDLGGALNRFDLSKAVEEFGRVEGASQAAADKMVSNSQSEWQQAGRNIQTVIAKIRDSLNIDDWFEDLPTALNDLFDDPPKLRKGAPGLPADPRIKQGPAVNPPALPRPQVSNPLDIIAPTRAPGTGGPTNSYSPSLDQLTQIAERFGLELTSGFRAEPGSFHATGNAGDFSGPPAAMRAFAEFMAANYGSQLQELIFEDPRFGPESFKNQIDSGQIVGPGGGDYGFFAGAGNHDDHVHVATGPDGLIPVKDGAVPVTVVDTAHGAYPSSASGTATSSAPSMGQIGSPLDQDFGASQGLAGLADNLTRFVGNLAFAPTLGALSAVSQASPVQGGYGLAGILGAQNMAAGLSPLGFGPAAMGPAPLGGGVGGPITPGIPGMPGPLGQPGPFGPPPGPVGLAPGQGGFQPSSGGFSGVGGLPLAAMQTAASGLDMLAPGAGQAAQTGIQLINRTIAYGGQAAAIGVNGLLETFGLHDSQLGSPQNSWIGRIASSLAGAAPALPTSAGQTQPPAPPQDDPNRTEHGQGQGQPPGPQINIENWNQAPHRDTQKSLADLQFQSHASWGGR